MTETQDEELKSFKIGGPAESPPTPRTTQLFGFAYFAWALDLIDQVHRAGVAREIVDMTELMLFSQARAILEQLRVQLDHPYDR